MSHKWHYFDEKDECCKFKSPFKNKVYFKTYCNRDAGGVIRHTEDKSKVDCLVCLKMINIRDYDRST